MKLNDKGYLLVEIVVASALAMTLAYFLVEITITIKNVNDDYYKSIQLETDKVLMTKVVMDDISQYNLSEVKVNSSSNYVNFIYKDYSGNQIVKRLSIVNRTFKYGVYNLSTNSYDNNKLYTKDFDSSLDIRNIKMENLCYLSDAYVNCSQIDTKNVTNGILVVNIPAYTLYSDVNYGINLVVPYNLQ